ncbi:MAG: alginate export family protein [bacterium]
MLKSFICFTAFLLILPTLSSAGNSSLNGLKPGSWVEVRGNVNKTGSSVVAEEIEVVEPDSSFDSDKMEITGLSTSELPTTETHLQVLDYIVTVSEKTRFENASRNTVPRFAVRKNEWVKVKANIEENGELFARVIRRIEPRDRFEISGQVRAVAVPESRVTVGGVEVAVLPEIELDFLEDIAGGNPLESFLKDDQKGVLFGIRPAENLQMGGQLTSENRADDERDLSRARKRDKQVFSGELKLALLWRINSKGSFTFAEGTFGIREELENRVHDETSRPRRLSRAYLYWELSKLARLQIGRQDFYDEREWIYDELLDAIRLHIWRSPLALELSGSFGREFLEEQNGTKGMMNAMGLLRTYLNRDHFLSAYIVDSHRRYVDNYDLKLYGLRSYSRPRRGLRHWLELAASRGQNGLKRINGYAVDLGLSNVFDMRLHPTITTGLAYASGDKDRENQDGAFHQTGLQDNNGKFGGVTSFRYYGEVFDPELSNRMITTLGLGVRPLRNLSTDLVFHTYHQDQASTDLGDTRLQVKPTGESKYLGWELDLIVGYRLLKRINMELILGRFEPGRAFRQNDPAHIAQFQTRVKF